ncbi:ribosomal protein L15 [Lindgomyces ingoldianus]|uniref:Ribosomal protein L15 n=1 Tax=Lindgomyces ingoldianus TaxID=673940 RepID=A0ACB6R780_9PLEO|nr:ribosomal protein L15 [Lindgomyces ingoldianus]KAF2475173.1 ribosomal protein L15 [Lindgomyces ingoldianus]
MPPRLNPLRLVSNVFSVHHASPIMPLLAPFLLPIQHRSASILSNLSDNRGAYNKKIRRGRGPASGKGKTAGRGQKGQHAHGKVPARFQGGQTPLEITQPPRGKNKYVSFKVEMTPINLDRIQWWIDQGRLDPTKPITIKDLNRTRCVHGVKKDGVKLLSRNADKLKSPINIIVSRASAAAIARVEALGGTVSTRFYSPDSIKRVLRGDAHPTVSLDADPAFIARTLPLAKSLSEHCTTLSNPDTPEEAKQTAFNAVWAEVSAKYKYRLADATSRRDIEYYRDPAHRGYLSHTVKEGQSPSLFFKVPGEAKDRKRQEARRKAVKASAENRLF